MGYFVSAILFLLFLYYFFFKRLRFFSPECFFTFIWSIISFGACFCWVWSIPQVSFLTWIIVLVGVISFCFGCHFIRSHTVKEKAFGLGRESCVDDNSLNYKFIYFFFILAAPFIFYMLFESISLIKAGWSLRDIRSSYYGINGYETYWASSIYMKVGEKFLVSPFKVAIVPITISTCLRKKPNFILILMSLLMVAVDVLTTGGRFILLYIAVEVVAALALLRKRIRIKKSVVFLSLLALVASLIAIVIVSNRRGMAASWINKIYEYFFCCIPLFDHYIPNIDSFTYGTASLNGLINPFVAVFSKITPIITPFEASTMGKLNIQQGVQLSPLINTNAFVTGFFYTYLDFGIFGTFLGMLLFGLWSKKRQCELEKMNTSSNLALYLLVIQGMFKTIQHMPFCASDYVLGLLLVHLFSKNGFKFSLKRNYFNKGSSLNVVGEKNYY